MPYRINARYTNRSSRQDQHSLQLRTYIDTHSTSNYSTCHITRSDEPASQDLIFEFFRRPQRATSQSLTLREMVEMVYQARFRGQVVSFPVQSYLQILTLFLLLNFKSLPKSYQRCALYITSHHWTNVLIRDAAKYPRSRI